MIETDKKVYYPGDLIECAVSLRLLEAIYSAESLVVKVKGKESFKFISRVKNQRSLQSKRTIVDQSFVICRFMPSELDAPRDYAFIFKYRIPAIDQQQQQWPASFHMRRDVKNRGELKLRTKYKLEVIIK